MFVLARVHACLSKFVSLTHFCLVFQAKVEMMDPKDKLVTRGAKVTRVSGVSMVLAVTLVPVAPMVHLEGMVPREMMERLGPRAVQEMLVPMDNVGLKERMGTKEYRVRSRDYRLRL